VLPWCDLLYAKVALSTTSSQVSFFFPSSRSLKDSRLNWPMAESNRAVGPFLSLCSLELQEDIILLAQLLEFPRSELHPPVHGE